jgi:ribosomal protein L11 methyltransferase
VGVDVTDTPRYPQVSIDVAREDSDEASSFLFDLGASGVEERDETTLLSGSSPGKVTLVASFETREEAEQAVAQIDPSWSPRVTEIVGDAWRDEWKKHFVPFRLTPSIVIRPPWESYTPASASEIVLELEPGRAFGTGLHATTALVARALEAHRDRLASHDILDVGTGSGILALVALALGAVRARAIDVDPDAIEVAIENARRNGLEDRMTADSGALSTIQGSFAVVTANIEARVLVPMADDLQARLAPGGLLVLSGVLGSQEDEVRKAFGGLVLSEAPREGEWVALVMSNTP